MMHAKGSGQKVAVGLLVAVALLAGVRAGAFEVGQRWTYQHTGPRPGSTEPNAIDGQRIRQVISAEAPQGPWVVEERYTEDANTVGWLHVSEGRQTTALEIAHAVGERVEMTYDTPVPYAMPEMDVATEKVIETVLRMKSPEFALPVKVVIWRLEDEDVNTPAGPFANCRHYQMTTHSTINAKVAKVPLVEERQLWYHPSVEGLVKEVYHKEPVKFLAWSQDGYSSTSVLAAFEKKADVPVASTVVRPRLNEANAPAASSPAVAPTKSFPIWMPAVVVVAFAAAVLILVKRPRRSSSK